GRPAGFEVALRGISTCLSQLSIKRQLHTKISKIKKIPAIQRYLLCYSVLCHKMAAKPNHDTSSMCMDLHPARPEEPHLPQSPPMIQADMYDLAISWQLNSTTRAMKNIGNLLQEMKQIFNAYLNR
ncbi:Hypothetical predicted protein, partial [Pelobates cultripes]